MSLIGAVVPEISAFFNAKSARKYWKCQKSGQIYLIKRAHFFRNFQLFRLDSPQKNVNISGSTASIELNQKLKWRKVCKEYENV